MGARDATPTRRCGCCALQGRRVLRPGYGGIRAREDQAEARLPADGGGPRPIDDGEEAVSLLRRRRLSGKTIWEGMFAYPSDTNRFISSMISGVGSANGFSVLDCVGPSRMPGR